MKPVMKWAVAMAAVVAFAGFAYAKTTSWTGAVTKYQAGKSITLKDAQGKAHTLQITKDTKTEGVIKVGAKVSVEASAKNAQNIKAMADKGTMAPAAHATRTQPSPGQ